MSTCCNCGNNDSSLYYYWDSWTGLADEDYDWRDNFPLVDCFCEICFDIANSEGKIQWKCDSN